MFDPRRISGAQRAAMLAAVALALRHPLAAQAQQVEFYYPADSVLAIPIGLSRTVPIQAYTSVGGSCRGVQQYSVTLLLDRNRFQVTAADSVPSSALLRPKIDSTANEVTLSASGPGAQLCYDTLAIVTLKADSILAPGTLLSLRINALLGQDGTDLLPGLQTGLLDVCAADNIWGDLDQDDQVTSRDALAALMVAVGIALPGGFVSAVGDVDGDQQVTSRDALFILSASIGLNLPIGVRTNTAIPARCAPLASAPERLLMFRGTSVYGVEQGDTVPVLFGLPPLAPYPNTPPRWSPDGKRILLAANTATLSYEVLAFDSLVTRIDTLTRSTPFDAGGDWAPDGAQIAFIRQSPDGVYVMDANGQNQKPIVANMMLNTGEPVSWSPDGTRIAFVASRTSGPYGVWVVNPDGTGLSAILPETAGQDPTQVVWSAAGDSIYYYSGTRAQVRSLAPAPGDTGRPAGRLLAAYQYPAASSLGIAYQASSNGTYSLYLRRRSDGRYLRLTRGSPGGESRYAFRRMGGVYVNAVTVSPDTATVSLSGIQTAQLSASVTNNDGSQSTAAVTWFSRNPTIVSVDSITGSSAWITGRTAYLAAYIIGTVRGWRSDSALVIVNP